MRSMLVLPTLLGAALLASQAQAAGKQVTLEGKFGQVISSQKVKPEVAGAPELAQNVRLDQLTSGDPDWNGATLTLYEHSESFPSYGLYKVYGVLAAPNGDKALVEFAGKWDVVTKDGQFVEGAVPGRGQGGGRYREAREGRRRRAPRRQGHGGRRDLHPHAGRGLQPGRKPRLGRPLSPAASC